MITEPVVRVVRTPQFQWTLVAVVATVLVAVMPTRRLRFWDNFIPFAFLTYGIGWFLWIRVVRTAMRVISRSPQFTTRASRWAIPFLLLVPLSWTIAWHECPHSRALYIFPCGFPVTMRGKPCGNAKNVRTIWDIALGQDGTRSY
ncbi:MAG: hypothetical protein WBD40_05265 [Tepidisphaeraceae bacterium]